MSEHVTELGELAVSLSAGPCSVCGARGRGVTFNAGSQELTAFLANQAPRVLARVGLRCGCWDSFLRVLTDAMVGAE